MFCQQCGKEVPDTARFCPSCGTATAQETGAPAAPTTPAPTASADVPLLVVRPRMLPGGMIFLKLLPVAMFFTVFCGGFCGIPSAGLIILTNLDAPPYIGAIIGGLFGMFGVPLIAYTLMKKNYDRMEYRFYPDRLEYYEGFFTVQEKTIHYRNVTEVNLSRGVFQKKVNLGTLVLSTPATGAGTGSTRSGITVVDIPDPQDVYQQVKDLVAQAR